MEGTSDEILQFEECHQILMTQPILSVLSSRDAEKHIRRAFKISQSRLHAAMSHLFTGGGKRL